MREEPFIEFGGGATRARVCDATAFRSTWITTSLLTLKARGYFLRYMDALPRELHDEVQFMTAASWIPVDLALTHYRACDALGLSEQELLSMGRDSSRRVQGSFVTTIVRMSRRAGATPWSGLAHVTRLWERSMQGGGVAVYRLGPKDARLEFAGFPLAQVPYVRTCLRGIALSILELYSRSSFVYDVPALCTARTVAYHLAWA